MNDDAPRPFDDRPRLEADGLRLDPMSPADLPELVAAAGDPAIWAGHPASDRWQPDRAAAHFAAMLARGGSLVLRDAGGSVLGASRFYRLAAEPDAICIGYSFVVRARWGDGTNARMKRMMLDHAFGATCRVLFHVGPDNHRSQAAVRKLGASHAARGLVDTGSGPTDYVTFALDRDTWAGRRAA